MNYTLKIFENIINHIENSLLEDISLDQLANDANISLSQMYRLFSLFTGMSIKEYVRLRRLTKSVIDINETNNKILNIAIKYGFKSQESYSRVFKKYFGVSPGAYRSKKVELKLLEKKDILNDFIHKASHDAITEGLTHDLNINIYRIFKPAHKWIAVVDRNPDETFYDKCEASGKMDIIDNLPGDLRNGGGYMEDSTGKIMAFYGKELPEDYDGEVPDFCEVFTFTSSDYMVFNCPPYAIEDHGSAIASTYKAMKEFNPQKYGYKWSKQLLPVYNDDDEFGFTLMKAIVKSNTNNSCNNS